MVEKEASQKEDTGTDSQVLPIFRKGSTKASRHLWSKRITNLASRRVTQRNSIYQPGWKAINGKSALSALKPWEDGDPSFWSALFFRFYDCDLILSKLSYYIRKL